MPATAIKYPETIGVRLPAHGAEQLRAWAERVDRPVSTLARRILIDALRRQDQVEPQAETTTAS